jgi:cell division protein FtsB
MLSTGIFFLAQLVINSNLSPLGSQLQKLNSEKEYLVEENEKINERLAKLDSIVVVKELAQKKLNFDKQNPQSTVYIHTANVLAEK